MKTGNTLKFVRLDRVKELTGLGRSQIYSLGKQGRFPRRYKILANTTVWIEEEIQTWMIDRVTQCGYPSLFGEKEAA